MKFNDGGIFSANANPNVVKERLKIKNKQANNFPSLSTSLKIAIFELAPSIYINQFSTLCKSYLQQHFFFFYCRLKSSQPMVADHVDRWRRFKRATFIRVTLIGGELPIGHRVTWCRVNDAAVVFKRDTSGIVNQHIVNH